MLEVIRIDTGNEVKGEYKDMIIDAYKKGQNYLKIGNTTITIQSSCKEKNIIKISVR